MSQYHVAVGLADAMLAGPPTARSTRARCARALDENPAWLAAVVKAMTGRFAQAWREESRQAIALAIREQPEFLQAWSASPRPSLCRYFLESPSMGPRPLGLEQCALPNLPTVGDISKWLQIGARELAWLSDRRGWESLARDQRLRHYRYRWIAKRSGGHRLLEVPKSTLRQVQRRILRELLEYIPPHPSAHAFRARYSCLTNAAPHVGQLVVIKMDLEDFFVGVHGARVSALFRTLGYPSQAAAVLAGLCTNWVPPDVLDVRDTARYKFELPSIEWRARKRYQSPHLPQGAPTSPALANLCAFNLDVRLQALAQSTGAHYTRYADDLAFSGGEALSRGSGRFVCLVAAIAQEEGFSVNFRKTRVMQQSIRQQVTGIVVNQKPNIRREDYDRLKATLHNCARFGPQSQNRDALRDYRAHLAGRIAHLGAINSQRGERLRVLFERIAW